MMPSFAAAIQPGLYVILLFVCAYLAILKLPGKSGVRGMLGFGVMALGVIASNLAMAWLRSAMNNPHPGDSAAPYLCGYISMISGLVGFVGLILIIMSLAALPKKSE